MARNKFTKCRVNDEEQNEFKKRAEKVGLTVTDYIKFCCLDQIPMGDKGQPNKLCLIKSSDKHLLVKYMAFYSDSSIHANALMQLVIKDMGNVDFTIYEYNKYVHETLINIKKSNIQVHSPHINNGYLCGFFVNKPEHDERVKASQLDILINEEEIMK